MVSWRVYGCCVVLAVCGLAPWAMGEEELAPIAEKGNVRLRVPDEARFKFGGLLGERIDANLRNWLLAAPRANPGMTEMFRERETPHSPPLVDWAGEFVGKYLISAVQARRMVASPELDAVIRQVVEELVAAQADDGYLGPFRKDERLLTHWDLWGHYHVMLGLLMVAEEMDCPPARTAALKAADLICATYLHGRRRVFDAGSQEMNMAVVHVFGRLYRLTGRERYLQMMRQIEEDWPRAGDYFRTGRAGVEFYKTPRPRWESLHDLQGLVEFYRITGNEEYATAFAHLWGSIRAYDRHNSGSFSTGEGAVGSPFRRGAIETCCTTAWVAISSDMLGLSADPRVADELELSTYNAVPAAQHPSGRWWTYDTPMDGRREASAHTIVFQARAGTPELNCCSVNGPRGLGMLSEWAVLADGQGPVVNHYGPSEISFRLDSGLRLTLIQETRYPAEGTVLLKVRPERKAKFALRLRIPAWSTKTQLSVNGQAISEVKPGTYHVIEREWSPGDTVEIAFDMTPRFLLGEQEKMGKASIYRGPLLLAFDEHHNSYGCGAIPKLDLKKLELKAERAHDAFPPVVLFDTAGADGRTVRLCDFATAGAHGSEYRSWLRTVADPAGEDRILVNSALDGDGQPRHGQLIAATQIVPAADRQGKPRGAVRFNGKNSKLQYAIAAFPEEDYSVCAWIRVEAFSSKEYQQVFSAWAKPMDDPLRICITGESVQARIEAGQAYATPAVKIEAGRWLHVAAVKEGAQLRLYVDGELCGMARVPEMIASAARSVAIGANPNFAGDEDFNGDIDAFSLWGTALSAERVKELARAIESP